jgi:hypothetical protein
MIASSHVAPADTAASTCATLRHLPNERAGPGVATPASTTATLATITVPAATATTAATTLCVIAPLSVLPCAEPRLHLLASLGQTV